ncbi:MAG: hypothetical protein ABI128_16385 [Rhodanobacter sp.]
MFETLPFAALDSELLMARLAALEQSGINPTMCWRVRSAVFALKRAAGRPAHAMHGRRVLVLSYPCLTSEVYGNPIRASVPPTPRIREVANLPVSLDDTVAS